MDDLTALPTEADYRRYDRIWQRVSPELTPYPEARAAQSDGAAERGPVRPSPPAQPNVPARPNVPEQLNLPARPNPPARPTPPAQPNPPARPNLPGQPNVPAQPNVPVRPGPPAQPDAALKAAELIQDFVREELAQAQTYRYLAGQAPTQEGRRLMRRFAADETAHVKTLQAAYFLLTGEAYRVTVVLPPQPRLPWRERLREQYLSASRDGAAYERAAAETLDTGLRRMFEQLAGDEYRHAELLRGLIEKTI